LHPVEDERVVLWLHLILHATPSVPGRNCHERWQHCASNMRAILYWLLETAFTESQLSPGNKAI